MFENDFTADKPVKVCRSLIIIEYKTINIESYVSTVASIHITAKMESRGWFCDAEHYLTR